VTVIERIAVEPAKEIQTKKPVEGFDGLLRML